MSRNSTPALKAASARWQRQCRSLKKAGLWEPFVPAEPVREHLRQINAAGMPYMAVAEHLNLAQNSSLQHVMWGRGDYGPGQQVRRETAELIMSYWPSLDDFPEAARIDATGTRRRVQALVARGWPRRLMAERVGMGETHFRKACRRERVTARLARRVAAVYDEWWDQDPLEYGVAQRSVDRGKAEAVRLGFHSPLAWDDDAIDDPAAEPLIDAATPKPTEGDNVVDRWLMGESVILGRDARRQAICHLMEWTNLTTDEVAERLDMNAEAVSAAWERAKRKARTEEGRRLWRRAYIPRERNLTKTDMEEVA